MTVAAVVERREITEVLHFTTNQGLLGMLASGGILSRQRLPEEKYLEHVYRPNAEVRKDGRWIDYVNLSISHINTEFFGHSKRWHQHEDVWWCVVSLDPVILTHEGVLFATTNNMYSGCRREAGEAGLEKLYAEEVTRWIDLRERNVAERDPELEDSATTCHQAEVLYPGCVPLEYFQRVYVVHGRHADIVGSQSEMLLANHAGPTGPHELPISIRPDVFEPR
jgi:hypothetical protein